MPGIFFVLLAAVAVFSGCATAGIGDPQDQVEVELKQKLVWKQTTVAELRAMFGEPIEKQEKGKGRVLWIYPLPKTARDSRQYVPFLSRHANTWSDSDRQLICVIDGEILTEHSILHFYKR